MYAYDDYDLDDDHYQPYLRPVIELDGFTYRDLTGGGLEGIHGYHISTKSPRERRHRRNRYDAYDHGDLYYAHHDAYNYGDFDRADWMDYEGDFDEDDAYDHYKY